MESHWSSFLVVAAVFTAFSGTASLWGRLQRRKRARQEALWRELLQAQSGMGDRVAASRDERPRAASTLPPDPSLADSPSFVSDSDSRRAALDGALERMSRHAPRRQPQAPSRAAPQPR